MARAVIRFWEVMSTFLVCENVLLCFMICVDLSFICGFNFIDAVQLTE